MAQIAARHTSAPRTKSDMRGFTLLEVLIAVVIIAILVSVALVVGRRVTESGRDSLSRSLLKVLSQTQESYTKDRDAAAPSKFTDTSALKRDYAIADGREATVGFGISDRPEPSLALYLLATDNAPSVKSAIGGLDARFIVRGQFTTDRATAGSDQSKIVISGTTPPSDAAGVALSATVIRDPWGNPYRYVHARYSGGAGQFFTRSSSGFTPGTLRQASINIALNNGRDLKLRRSFRPGDPETAAVVGDADEGLATGGMGYFYSAGADGDAGTREDNVYASAPPPFPPETARVE